MSCNVFLFGWLFKLSSDNFRNIESLNNVTPQYLITGKFSSLRFGRHSGLVKVFAGWLGSKTYCGTNTAVGKNAFCQPNREANRLGEIEESDRLNVL